MTNLNPRQALRKLYAECRKASLYFEDANPKLVDATPACTFAMLIRRPVEDDPNSGEVIGTATDDSGSSATRIRLEYRSAGDIMFRVDGGGTNSNLTVSTVLDGVTTTEWHTIIGTFDSTGEFGGTAPDPLEDGDQAFIYVNGVEAGDGEASTPNDSVLAAFPDLEDGTFSLASAEGNNPVALDVGAAIFANAPITAAEAASLDKLLRGKDPAAARHLFPPGSVAFQFFPVQYPGGRIGVYEFNSPACLDLANKLPASQLRYTLASSAWAVSSGALTITVASGHGVVAGDLVSFDTVTAAGDLAVGEVSDTTATTIVVGASGLADGSATEVGAVTNLTQNNAFMRAFENRVD